MRKWPQSVNAKELRTAIRKPVFQLIVICAYGGTLPSQLHTTFKPSITSYTHSQRRQSASSRLSETWDPNVNQKDHSHVFQRFLGIARQWYTNKILYSLVHYLGVTFSGSIEPRYSRVLWRTWSTEGGVQSLILSTLPLQCYHLL